RQQDPEESSADDRHGVMRFDLRALENVHDAPERLAGKCDVVELARQLHNGVSSTYVEIRVRVPGDQHDAIADRKIVHVRADGFDDTPTFVPGRAGFSRVLEPGPPLPYCKIGRAHAAAFETHSHLA